MCSVSSSLAVGSKKMRPNTRILIVFSAISAFLIQGKIILHFIMLVNLQYNRNTLWELSKCAYLGATFTYTGWYIANGHVFEMM